MRRSRAWLFVVSLLAIAGCGDPVTKDVAGKNMKLLAGGTRAQRLEALAQIPGFKFVPADCEAAILECLADTDAAVRTDAAQALQYIDPKTQAHLETAIRKALDTEADAEVKRNLKLALDVVRGTLASPDGNAAPIEPPVPSAP